MAGLFDKIRRAVEPDDDSYDYDEDEIYSSNDDDGIIRTNNNAQMNNMYGNNPQQQQGNFSGGYNQMPNAGNQVGVFQGNNQQGNNMTPNNTPNMSVTGNKSSFEIKTIAPKDNVDTLLEIARHLLNRRVVVLNLEGTNKEMKRRFIDFLGGVTFAIGGTTQKVSNDTFILSPSNVDISAVDQVRNDDSNRLDRPIY